MENPSPPSFPPLEGEGGEPSALRAASSYGRIRWRCRRGLLELDLFLQRFIERDFPCLAERELSALERLLELPDPELLDYCNGAARPDDPELQALVAKISAR